MKAALATVPSQPSVKKPKAALRKFWDRVCAVSGNATCASAPTLFAGRAARPLGAPAPAFGFHPGGR